MATYLGIVELGGLYKSGAIQPRPTLPWRITSEPYTGCGVGNIADFSTLQDMTQWTVGDTPANTANRLKWHKIQDGSTTLLVCDRNILVNVSWADLNGQNLVAGKTITIDGQQYKIRLLTGGGNYRTGTDNYSGGTSPTANEWDRFITREEAITGLAAPVSTDLNSTLNATDKNSTHNQLWNWMGVYSWAQETYIPYASNRAVRGCSSARCFYNNAASVRLYDVGWRPALEILNTAPLISDSDRDLGSYSSVLQKTYQVTDAEGNTFTIVEKLDGTTIRTLNNQTNGSFTLDLTSQWPSLSLASHTVIVEATDQNNAKSTRTWTFTKTNNPPNTPTLTGPTNNTRVEQAVDVVFTPATDQDGDNQYFKVEVADDSGFTSGKQTFTVGLQRFNTDTQTWEDVSFATNTDSGKTFRIPVSGLLLNSTKYIRVGSTDTSGSNITTWSSTISVEVGTVLEVQTIPTETAYMPTRITIKDKKIVDSRAGITVQVCNNAFDAIPTWEDMTEQYNTNTNYAFTNTEKTAEKWGISVKYIIQANDSTGEISISAIGMGVS